MSIKTGVASSLCAVMLALGCGAVEAGPADAGTAVRADGALTIQQLVQVPNLRADRSQRHGTQSHWVVRGQWKYTLRYVNHGDGWHLDRYTVAKADSDKATAADDNAFFMGSGHGSIGPGDPVLLPGPGIIPVPPTLEDPQQPTHSGGHLCPIAPGVDASWEWEWIPTHEETDENGFVHVVEGHWELQTYTISNGGSDLCD